MNNTELIRYIYSNDELFNDISKIWNIDHIESHINDIRDYINQDKKYIVSIEFFDGTHQDINQ